MQTKLMFEHVTPHKVLSMVMEFPNSDKPIYALYVNDVRCVARTNYQDARLAYDAALKRIDADQSSRKAKTGCLC